MKKKPSLHDIEAFNEKRKQELEQEPSMLEEDSDIFDLKDPSKHDPEILRLIKHQKSEIDRIDNELTRVVDQLKAHERLLEKQNQEIAQLKQERHSNTENEPQKTREADLAYNKELILRNIIMLIEEKGFSYNDVARLFKLEGFLPPSPYAQWDTKTVEELYTSAG